jgi:hypothetical protein
MLISNFLPPRLVALQEVSVMADGRPDQAKEAPPKPRLPAHGPLSRPADLPIVGIGASVGGLDACRKFLAALPADNDMAFILVQHLDPDHESMLVDLLASHTTMTVSQATEGMRIERDHLYIIPPGAYLSIGDDVLHLSQPSERHGARHPFDFLLRSMLGRLSPVQHVKPCYDVARQMDETAVGCSQFALHPTTARRTLDPCLRPGNLGVSLDTRLSAALQPTGQRDPM